MSDALITVATFESAANAHAARARLEADGIRAVVTDDIVVETLWNAGAALGGIRLRVLDADLSRAREILNEIENRDVADTGPWRCRPCQEEVEGMFDVCWSCSRPREEVEDRSYVPQSATEEPQLAIESDSRQRYPEDDVNPYRSSHQLVESEISAAAAPLDVEDTVRRALRTSLIALVICPIILHFYSMYLLAVASLSGQSFTWPATWRFYVALVINILATIVYLYAGWRM